MRAMQISTSIAMAVGFAMIGCSDSKSVDVLTYDEFKARAYQEPETGAFVINGDELVETEAQLREVYDSYLETVALANGEGYGTIAQALIVNRVGGADDKWSAAAAQSIRYCISQSSFGNRYNAVVTAMNSATATWEATSRTNFVHTVASDSNCTRTTAAVVFNVRQVSGTGFLARAFFPSSSRANREILIDASSFGNINPYTLAGILRHELGHTLGFRHEHTRPESGSCFENNSWRALTTYDAASVMHYPQCNGTNNGDLNLTARDRSGAAALYP